MQRGYVYMPKHLSLLIPHSEKKVTKLLSYLLLEKNIVGGYQIVLLTIVDISFLWRLNLCSSNYDVSKRNITHSSYPDHILLSSTKY